MKRGIFYTLLTQAPILALYFVSSTLMTRMLGDVGRGEYALLINDGVMLAMLLSLNLSFGVSYFTAKNNNNISMVTGISATLLTLHILLVPILLLALWYIPISNSILLPGGNDQLLYLGFLYLIVCCNVINTTVSGVLMGLKKFKVVNSMSIFTASSSMIGFTTLYYFRGSFETHNILRAVLVISFINLIIQSIIWIIIYFRSVKVKIKPIWSWKVIQPVLAFSLVGYVANLLNLINYRFDVWVIDHYQGSSQLGLYAVAVGLGQLLFYVPEPFSRVVQPFLFGQVKDEMLAKYKVIARLNFTSVLIISIVIAITAKWFIPMLYGEGFMGSVFPLWYLLPGILFSSVYKLLAPLVINANMQQFNLLATGAGAFVTIVLGLIIIPIWGIKGAAMVSSISYFVILLVVLLVMKFKLKIPVHDLFFLRYSDLGYLRNSNSIIGK